MVRHNTPLSATINNRKVTTASILQKISINCFELDQLARFGLTHSCHNMHYPSPLRRLGVVPGLLRLIAVVLEVLSLILLCLRHDPEYSWKTSYVIVSLLMRFLAREF